MQTTWTEPWATEELSKRLDPGPYPIGRRMPTPIGRAGEERATSEIGVISEPFRKSEASVPIIFSSLPEEERRSMIGLREDSGRYPYGSKRETSEILGTSLP